MSEAADRTRTWFARELDLDLAPKDASYREQAAGVFEGEWLGAFAQPAIVVNTVTPVSLRLDDTGGNSVDEYGKALLAIQRAGDRVQITKSYEGITLTPAGEHFGRFVYVGQLHAGTLAGYWYAEARPQFCGVFWFSRVDQLKATTAETLQARVRGTSPKRTLMKASVFAVTTGSVVFAWIAPAVSVGLLGVGAIGMLTLRSRTRALRREVAAWVAALRPK